MADNFNWIVKMVTFSNTELRTFMHICEMDESKNLDGVLPFSRE